MSCIPLTWPFNLCKIVQIRSRDYLSNYPSSFALKAQKHNMTIDNHIQRIGSGATTALKTAINT